MSCFRAAVTPTYIIIVGILRLSSGDHVVINQYFIHSNSHRDAIPVECRDRDVFNDLVRSVQLEDGGAGRRHVRVLGGAQHVQVREGGGGGAVGGGELKKMGRKDFFCIQI